MDGSCTREIPVPSRSLGIGEGRGRGALAWLPLVHLIVRHSRSIQNPSRCVYVRMCAYSQSWPSLKRTCTLFDHNLHLRGGEVWPSNVTIFSWLKLSWPLGHLALALSVAATLQRLRQNSFSSSATYDKLVVVVVLKSLNWNNLSLHIDIIRETGMWQERHTISQEQGWGVARKQNANMGRTLQHRFYSICIWIWTRDQAKTNRSKWLPAFFDCTYFSSWTVRCSLS